MIVLTGASSRTAMLDAELRKHGMSTVRHKDRAGYPEEFVGKSLDVIIIDGDQPDWRYWVTRARGDRLIMRVPLVLLTGDGEITAEALRLGVEHIFSHKEFRACIAVSFPKGKPFLNYIVERIATLQSGQVLAGDVPASQQGVAPAPKELADYESFAEPYALTDRYSLPEIDWVEVPAGPFFMGSNSDDDPAALENEIPKLRQHLDAYYISRYTITNAQFQIFLEASDGYTARQWWSDAGWGWKGERKLPDTHPDPVFRLANHPRTCVRWYEAVAFSRWLSAKLGYSVRLPSEKEWEKAARGPDGLIYPWGNEFDASRLNSYESGIGKPCAVGLFPKGASPYGALDMSGNVWEWCVSLYEDLDGTHTEGEDARVLKGGSWFSYKEIVRCAYRYKYHPSRRADNGGFRLICHEPR